jgi:hypothetical protein
MGNTTIVSKKEAIEERNEQRQKMVDLLTAKIDKAEKDLTTKLYIVEGGKVAGESISDFLTNKAQWKFSEALGVVEAVKQVNDSLDKIKTGKTKEFMITSLPLEAIYYFMTKAEGTGLLEAETFVLSVLKPVTDALQRSKQDRDVLDQLVRDRGTLESAIDSGVDLENEDTILIEISKELEKEI